MPVGKAAVNDDVGQPGFVFQRDEHDPAGGTRPLPAGDDAGHTRQGAIRQSSQFSGGNEFLFTEAFAQQTERMTTERKTNAGVVGDEVFGFAWRREYWRPPRRPGDDARRGT